MMALRRSRRLRRFFANSPIRVHIGKVSGKPSQASQASQNLPPLLPPPLHPSCMSTSETLRRVRSPGGAIKETTQ